MYDTNEHTIYQIAATHGVSRPTIYRSLQRTRRTDLRASHTPLPQRVRAAHRRAGSRAQRGTANTIAGAV